MARLILPPPEVFQDSAISDETRALNAEIIAKIDSSPDQWSFPPEQMRSRRRSGLGPFPVAPRAERAETIEIEGPHGPIPLRVIAPETPKGVYLHIHGGGWVFGGSDEQDPRLERIVDNCGLAVVSVEYRLAPEYPYPIPCDDCEAAALWLVKNGKERFGTDAYAIGGESAGGHLSVVTMLRLRDRHGLKPFKAANLVAGCYDLRLTPSAANWGTQNLILTTRDITNFIDRFVPRSQSLTDPDVSPIFADVSGMPPALFSVGTLDSLYDDSLFLAMHWAAAGNDTELAVYPGGAHVFMAFPGAMSQQALDRMDAFLGSALA